MWLSKLKNESRIISFEGSNIKKKKSLKQIIL